MTGTGSGDATVDIVMVTYNSCELTLECLARIRAATDGLDVRVLVHDNGSVDGTAQRIAAEFPEIDVVAGAENVGFARAVNAALRRVTARYVLLLNSDAWLTPGALERMLVALRGDPQVAAVVPRIESPSGDLEFSTLPFPSLRVAALTAVDAGAWWPARAARHLVPGAWMHDRERVVDWAVGAAWLVPRERFEQLGGLDERFFMYAEDVEWCWRAADSGHRVLFVPDAVVIHVGQASSGERYRGSRRARTHIRNSYRLLSDRWGPGRVVAYRLLQVVGCLRRATVELAHRRRPAARRALGEAAAHLGWVGDAEPLSTTGDDR